ncbi:hypothetical protein HK405_003859 [Cladochytrium tenue]|nr:hypothetical protein HK405_003859 [Cladochytrium tenue]
MGLVKDPATPQPAATPATASARASAAEHRLAQLLNLAPCPATQLAQYAATGWRRPTGSNGGFLVCPACFDASLSHTPHAALFTSAGTSPGGGIAFRCGFSLPWVRVAWTWILRRGMCDVELLVRVAAVSSKDGFCPNQKVSAGVSKPTAVRTWFTMRDPVNGRLMVEWTICSHCCAAIETILPPFRDYKLLVPAALEPCEASCDLVPGSNRMLQYANEMMDFAWKSIDTGRMADLRPLANYIEDFATIPLCPRGTPTSGPCYLILFLDLAVCEECYNEVVMRRRLATSVTEDKAFVQNWTCQLYSPRSRRLLAQCESVSNQDSWNTFRQWAIKRADKERETRLRVQQLKAQTETLRCIIDFYSGLAELRAMSLTHERKLRQLRGSDDGAGAASQGNSLQDRVDDDKFRLRSVSEEIELIERDWRDFWE